MSFMRKLSTAVFVSLIDLFMLIHLCLCLDVEATCLDIEVLCLCSD